MTVDGSRDQLQDVPLRVLFALHGHEPAEWMGRACRLVSAWSNVRVRVLGVVDVPSPPFTSLIPPARRLYIAAREAWSQDEGQRVQAAIDRLVSTLGCQAEVVREPSSGRGLAHTIDEHAMGWRADVILVAAPTRLSQSWMWPGPVHDRLLRRAAGAVLAVPVAPRARRVGRVLRMAHVIRVARTIAPAGRPASARLAR